MKDKVNAYLAVFIITVVGSGAAMIIVQVATLTSDEIEASLGVAQAYQVDGPALR